MTGADPSDVTAWMRAAGFTPAPWQERLAVQVFANPDAPLRLAGPYRSGRAEWLSTYHGVRDTRRRTVTSTMTIRTLPLWTRLRLRATRRVDLTACWLVDHGRHEAALRALARHRAAAETTP